VDDGLLHWKGGHGLLRNRHLLEELEREFLSREKRDLEGNLELLDAMWEEAVHLQALPPSDPLEGIEVDLRIARTVNSV